MPTNTDLQMICNRGLQALTEVKGHAVALANLQNEIRAAQSTLAGLQGQIAEAQNLAKQVDEIGQLLRTKKVELAEVSAEVAKKHALHGEADSALRDLRKRITGDPTHV